MYQIIVLKDNRLAFSAELECACEIGRQQSSEPEPCALVRNDSGMRLIIANRNATEVSRRQMLVTPLKNGAVTLENLSTSVTFQVISGPQLAPEASCRVLLPASISFGGRTVLTLDHTLAERKLSELAEATAGPGLTSMDMFGAIQTALSTDGLGSTASASAAGRPEHLVKALQSVMDVFQSARTTEELFASAVQGAMSLIRFDYARVLLCDGAAWKEETAECNLPRKAAPPASRQVLRRVKQRKRTFWDAGGADSPKYESLSDVDAVIGAPILDAAGEVIGVLYGGRQSDSAQDASRPITRLDAQLMELLACGVASGLARRKQEDIARRLRHQFEQFFTPQLAAELEQHPDLLEGREAEVSVLFCDIRGFSRITERIDAGEMFAWINDCMAVLSECVLGHDGVLVDYIGDELLAMWGAPQAQPDHAVLAVRAALDMIAKLPELNERWSRRLGEPIDLGIGVNSGLVKVGNSGSPQKFKYGPLGNTVNLASRVQGATKHVKSRLLVTGATAARLEEEFFSRKLCDVQVVNLAEAVPLVEISQEPAFREIAAAYRQGLDAFEKRQFRQAARRIAALLDEHPDDGPSLVLLSRAVAALVEGTSTQHPVWKLPGK